MSMIVHNVVQATKDGPDAIAVITATTALIALAIPFILSALEIRRTKRIRKERAHEATSATFNGLDVLVDAIRAFHQKNQSGYASAAARAKGYAGVATTFIGNPILTDGSIFCLINMRLAMESIIDGDAKAKAGQWNSVKGDLDAALSLANPANERGQEVRKNMGIKDRTCGYWPQLPATI